MWSSERAISPPPAASPRRSRTRSCSCIPAIDHLFADRSLPDYDERAAGLLKQRVLSFLENLE
jgi:hypothetical protein